MERQLGIAPLQFSQAPAPLAASADVSSQSRAPAFQSKVNLVMVPVVVRDERGDAVGNLTKDDFELFDKGARQQITRFVVEKAGGEAAKAARTAASTEVAVQGEAAEHVSAIPDNFIAYLFDDVDLKTGDLLGVRNAATRHMNSLRPTDRAAVFTTSGQGNLDFTDDQAKLHEALLRLQPRPVTGSVIQQCPYMTYFIADLIVNKNDPLAINVATQDALQCSGLINSTRETAAQAVDRAEQMVQSAAQEALSRGASESQLVLGSVKDVVRRMAGVPGQRTVVLVSPGFLTLEMEAQVTDIIDHALRGNVIVSTVDARGLYAVPPFGDVSQRNMPSTPASQTQEAIYDIDAASADDNVLSDLAESTGGTFFHNSNDLALGLKQAAEAPTYYYVLAFSPQNLKYDGRFHRLSVKLTNPAKLTVQARQGYYAPRKAPDVEQEAHQEIQEAVFSQEEMHDLPVDLHTQFFKPTDVDAKLAVVVHVDVKRLHFRKSEGRNNDNLIIVAALFDHNGGFITGNEKTVELRLKDETLERKVESGVTLKTSFDVKPGSYLVRLVVRDTEGLISAENGAVEIP